MRAQLLFIIAAATIAFAFGLNAPPSAEPAVNALRPMRLGDASAITRPGLGASAAATYLALLNPPPKPPPVPLKRAPVPPPPPPPPDFAKMLAAAITAVVHDQQGLALVIVNQPGSPGRRVLHVGDIFADGWRVQKVTYHDAIIVRGPDQRIVSFFTNPLGALR